MDSGRKRARQACTACNTRRVKCNLAEEHPCRNCKLGGALCQARQSRRGKHPRTGGRNSALNPQTNVADGSRTQLDAAAASCVLATLSQNRQPGQEAANSVLSLPHLAKDQPEQPQQYQAQSEPGQIHHSPKSPHEVTRADQIEGGIFLGESTTLRYVHQEADEDGASESSHETPRLLHHMPTTAEDTANSISDWEMDCRQAKIRLLREEGAFSFPEPETSMKLLRLYFKWFHPCFAIVDEPEFWHNYQNDIVSPLLLNAILFIAVLHSDEETLSLDCGLARAKFTFYTRAKDLYDADYESDKIVVLQSLFLLSFWRNGPFLEKDTRHWLAAAISLGQSKALHRRTQTNSANFRQERVKKRLWWSIYTRERQCAAALGLPNRISDKDSDVLPLEAQDFEHAFAKDASPEDVHECMVYQIGMTELSRILGQIVHCGYLPGKTLTREQKSRIKEELETWRSKLPDAMQLKNGFDDLPSLRTGALHLASNNLVILLYRNDYIVNNGGDDNVACAALQAASRNARIIEDLLPSGLLRHAQVHAITNLFNTLCVHVISLRRATGPAAPIAEHRAKVCLLGLQELQQTWDVRNWILQLFFQYLDRSTASRLLAQGESGRARKQKPQPRVQKHRTKHNKKQQQKIGTQSSRVPDLQPNRVQHEPSSALWGGEGWGIVPDSPWSLSTDDQTDFLFSQIENDFSFGEGCLYSLRADGPVNLPTSYWGQEELRVSEALTSVLS